MVIVFWIYLGPYKNVSVKKSVKKTTLIIQNTHRLILKTHLYQKAAK